MQSAAIIAADLHLSEHVWPRRPSITGDSFYALTQVIDVAVERRCPLILAGDVLELMHSGSPTSDTVARVGLAIRRMRDAGLPVYYVCGQHDLANPSWLESIDPHAVDMSMRSVQIAGRQWFGIGYQEAESLSYCIDAIPDGVDSLVCHQRWQELSGGSHAHGSLAEVISRKPNLRLIVSGDLHQWMCKQIQRCTVLSPGATHMRAVGEPKQHAVVCVDSGGALSAIQLKSRPVLSVQVPSEEKWASLLPQIGAQLQSMVAKALELGIPPTVATPLLIVQDNAICGALEQAKAMFSGVSHVLPKSPQVSGAADPLKSDLTWTESQHVVGEDTTLAAVSEWTSGHFGAGSEMAWLIDSLVRGEPVESIRRAFLMRYSHGNSATS